MSLNPNTNKKAPSLEPHDSYNKHGLLDPDKPVYLHGLITKTRLFKYIENFTIKNWKFSDKNSDIFLYFCSKHSLWVLVRSVSQRQFQLVHTI